MVAVAVYHLSYSSRIQRMLWKASMKGVCLCMCLCVCVCAYRYAKRFLAMCSFHVF